jgi:hypothetical protein
MLKRSAIPIMLFLIAMFGVGAYFGPWIAEQHRINDCYESGRQWDFEAENCSTPP